MRELLYRGKRIDNGEWVYGYVARFRNVRNQVYTAIIQICDDETKECNIQDLVPVLDETICEYTGLTDKNGNKIFEGDIIKVVTEDTHEERFIEVGIGEFTDDGSGDLFIGAYLKYDGFTVSAGQIKECGSNGVEIIGNIYDNPELLTNKND